MTEPRPSRRRLLRAAPLAAAVLLAAGPACRTRAAEVLARVGSTDVSVEEVRAYVETLTPAEQAALAKDPALLSRVVRAYLARQAVLRDAQGKRFEQQPAIKAQLDRLRDQALIDLFLDSIARLPDGFPSDAEVQAAYEANRAALSAPRQFRVAQLYVALPRGADKAAEEKARRKLDDLVKRVKAKGADFAAVARADSEDAQTAQRGGEIGWLTEEQMVPGIRATATALVKDAVSEPVRLDDGWHVLKLLETRAAGPLPLADVREPLARKLREAKAAELRQAYLARLLEQSPPAINELALARVLAAPRGK